MKAEYANPFIRGAISVFEKELHIKLTRKDLKKKEAPLPSFPVSIIIGVTGPIKGQVVYPRRSFCIRSSKGSSHI